MGWSFLPSICRGGFSRAQQDRELPRQRETVVQPFLTSSSPKSAVMLGTRWPHRPIPAFPGIDSQGKGVSRPRRPLVAAALGTAALAGAPLGFDSPRTFSSLGGECPTPASLCQPGSCCTLIYWPNIPGVIFCSVFCFLEQPLRGLIIWL